MNREFEAYHSKAYSAIFAVLFFAITACNVFTSLGGTVDVYATILLSILALVTVYFLVFTITRNGVAIEVVDDVLILHKKQDEAFLLSEIHAISMHDGAGSFDISIKMIDGRRASMHCFVKEDRKKKKELIDLLSSKGVRTQTFDID